MVSLRIGGWGSALVLDAEGLRRNHNGLLITRAVRDVAAILELAGGGVAIVVVIVILRMLIAAAGELVNVGVVQHGTVRGSLGQSVSHAALGAFKSENRLVGADAEAAGLDSHVIHGTVGSRGDALAILQLLGLKATKYKM
jgi:hypothetical protein